MSISSIKYDPFVFQKYMSKSPFGAKAKQFLGYGEIDNYIEQFGLEGWQQSIDSTKLGLGNYIDTYA